MPTVGRRAFLVSGLAATMVGVATVGCGIAHAATAAPTSIISTPFPKPSTPASETGASIQTFPPQPAPTVVANGPVAVKLTRTPSPSALTYLSPGGARHQATLSGGRLTVDGASVASSVGEVFWSNDGTVLFYDTAPPPTDPMAQEPIYSVSTGGLPKKMSTTDDPWRLSAAGPHSAAFSQNGVLKIVNGEDGVVSSTPVALPTVATDGHFAYPSHDSDFRVSPDLKTVVVADPTNHLTLYHLSPSQGGFVVEAKQELPGAISGNREDWGAWQKDGRQFLYAMETSHLLPRLGLWSVTAGTATQLGAQLAPSESGQFLILGWTSHNSSEFVVNQVSNGAPRGGPYILGSTDGSVVEVLWNHGFGGYMAPDDSTVTFSSGLPPRMWTAQLRW